jgi:hypothetical protein
MDVSLKDLKEFFGYEMLKDFAKDWKVLSDQDKEDIKEGVGNGTFNY